MAYGERKKRSYVVSRTSISRSEHPLVSALETLLTERPDTSDSSAWIWETSIGFHQTSSLLLLLNTSQSPPSPKHHLSMQSYPRIRKRSSTPNYHSPSRWYSRTFDQGRLAWLSASTQSSTALPTSLPLAYHTMT